MDRELAREVVVTAAAAGPRGRMRLAFDRGNQSTEYGEKRTLAIRTAGPLFLLTGGARGPRVDL